MTVTSWGFHCPAMFTAHMKFVSRWQWWAENHHWHKEKESELHRCHWLISHWRIWYIPKIFRERILCYMMILIERWKEWRGRSVYIVKLWWCDRCKFVTIWYRCYRRFPIDAINFRVLLYLLLLLYTVKFFEFNSDLFEEFIYYFLSIKNKKD